MDPGTAVGVASLGIQVCQGLVQYYDSWKNARSDIFETLDCVKALGSIFDSLHTVLRSNQLDQQNTANIEEQLKRCEAGVGRLERKYSKIKSSKIDSFDRFKSELLRLSYPFKFSTLTKIKEMVADLIGHLQLALGVLGLAESTKFHAVIQTAVKDIASNLAVIELNLQDIKRDLTAISSATSQISKSADSIHILSRQIDQTTLHVDQQTADIKTDTSSLANEAFSKRQKAFLDWLCPEDFSKQHEDFIGRRQEGSGKWFLQDPEVRTWLNSANTTLLCEGDPGVGKTILAAVAIDHLLTTTHSPATPVLFVYCNYRRSDEHTCSFLLRSLLRQIVSSQITVVQTISDLKDKCERAMRAPSLTEVQETLAVATQGLSGLTIVIDALDECPRDVVTSLAPSLTDLRKLCKVRLMATSRPSMGAITAFDDATRIKVYASNDDIERYVRERMTKFSGRVQFNVGLQDEIVKAVITASDGVFLLAQLRMDSLQDKITIRKLRDALGTLPHGSDAYDAAYDEAMARVHAQQQDYRELATKVFSWIVHARRPLSMSELQHVLAVEIGDTDFDKDNIPSVHEILLACVGLVANDEQSNVVRLVHYTAQEYFNRTQSKWLPNANVDVAHICVTYLKLDTFARGQCVREDKLQQRLKEFPFLPYAARHWVEHYRECSTEDRDSSVTDFGKAVLQFLETPAAVRSCGQWTTRGLEDKFLKREDLQGIHLIAKEGLEEPLKAWIGRQGNLNVERRLKGSPLCIAAEHGHVKVVQLLLGTGQVQADLANRCHETPLSLAAAQGHHEVVELLLATGEVNADWSEPGGRTPLSLAARAGHYKVVELLLDTGKVSVDSRDMLGWTPFSWAARNGHDEVMELLLRTGKVDVDSRGDDGRTPLSLASQAPVSASHKNIDLLLRTGKVDPDSRDERGKTPLSWAAGTGHHKMVEQLLRTNEVDVDSKDWQGQTPFSWASECAQYKTAELLLRTGKVDPDSRDERGKTPLAWAVSTSYSFRSARQVDIINLLLDTAKVNVDSKDAYGCSPLCQAAQEGCDKEIIDALLRHNANADLTDNDGNTPLYYAAYRGHQETVELLLRTKSGTDLKAFAEPAMPAAIWGKHSHIVELLVQHGADVHKIQTLCLRDQERLSQKGHL